MYVRCVCDYVCVCCSCVALAAAAAFAAFPFPFTHALLLPISSAAFGIDVLLFCCDCSSSCSCYCCCYCCSSYFAIMSALLVVVVRAVTLFLIGIILCRRCSCTALLCFCVQLPGRRAEECFMYFARELV